MSREDAKRETEKLLDRLQQQTAGAEWYGNHLQSITHAKYESPIPEEKALHCLCAAGPWKLEGETRLLTIKSLPVERIREIKSEISDEIRKQLHLTFIYSTDQKTAVPVMGLQQFRNFAHEHKYGEKLPVVGAQQLPQLSR